MKTHIYLLTILLIHIPARIDAQQVDSLDSCVPASLYLEIATALAVGNVSINYETPLQNHMLLRIGFGAGYYLGWESENATSVVYLQW